jgi:hypothetical protein
MGDAVATRAAQSLAAGAGTIGAGAIGRYYRKPRVDPRTLYRQVLKNRGELHNKQYTGSITVTANSATVLHLTNISQGDDSDARTGRHITVYGYSLRGKLEDRALDCYIIHSKSGIAPVFADFQDIIGGHLKDESNKDLRIIRDLRNYRAQTTYFRADRRYKKGINTSYSGALGSDVVKNGYYLVFLNTTSGNLTAEYSMNFYYRDN